MAVAAEDQAGTRAGRVGALAVAEAVAGLFTALAATVLLLHPERVDLSLAGGLPELARYTRLAPLALAVGVVAAVGSCALLSGARARAWPAATGALGVAAALTGYFGARGYYGTMTVDLALAVRFATVVCAGVALGAAATRAWRHTQSTPAVGVAAGMLLGLLAWPAFTHAAVGTLPPEVARALPAGMLTIDPVAARWAVLGVAVALAGAAVVLVTALAPEEGAAAVAAPRQDRAALAATVVLVFAQLAVADILTSWSGPPLWAVLVVAFGVAGLSVAACAVLLTWVDGPWSGVLLLVATAVAAAAFPVLAGLGSASLGFAPGWALLLVPAAVVAGLAWGVRHHHRGGAVLNGLLLVAATPVAGLALGGSGWVDPAGAAVAQLALLGAGAGYGVGVCLPGAGPRGTLVAFGAVCTAAGFAALSPGALPGSGAPPGGWPAGVAELVAVVFTGVVGAGVMAVGARWPRQRGRDAP